MDDFCTVIFLLIILLLFVSKLLWLGILEADSTWFIENYAFELLMTKMPDFINSAWSFI